MLRLTSAMLRKCSCSDDGVSLADINSCVRCKMNKRVNKEEGGRREEGGRKE